MLQRGLSHQNLLTEPSDGAKPQRQGRPHGKTSAKTPESVSMVKVIQ